MMEKASTFLSLFTIAIQKPKVRKWLWRHVYEMLPLFAHSNLDFMNYGYAPLHEGEDNLTINPDDGATRYGIWLYRQLLEAVEVRDRRVLEVGCGRGGGSAFILRCFAPHEVVGVDYSKRAVALCKKGHRAAGLSFVHGDAEHLVFKDELFDLVVNVESSHCYGSMDRFLAEVVRVLRSGGHFLFADFREVSEAGRLHVQVERAGMSVVRWSDITAHVVAALRRDSARRRQFIRSRMPRALWKPLEEFAGIEDTVMYKNLCSGRFQYFSSVMQKH